MMQAYYLNSITQNRKDYLISTLTLFNTIIIVQKKQKNVPLYKIKIHDYESKNNRTLQITRYYPAGFS